MTDTGDSGVSLPYHYDLDRHERLSDGVVAAVAAVVGADPTAVPEPDGLTPLYDAVDPEALDALFSPGTDGHVTFRYHGYEVTAYADERVIVRPADDPVVRRADRGQ
ncbi:HalOD1 output domain-containing protein [Haloarcula litorea]|uniref:HalOD1 output domain-containing protein n=1 Tax=Haloarcula litorea TaxID=3032579 RepID=UPI0023E7883D|nr:HalOD1 output domain-containing protein [Halomicroarcula sp. GDY20]